MGNFYNVAVQATNHFSKKLSVLFVLVLCSSLAIAQQGLSTYSIARSTGVAYTSISGTGTPFPGWRNGTSTDDNMSTAVPIGFNFLFDGVQVCEVNASTNGFLNLLTSTISNGTGTGGYGYQNTAFSTATLRTIAPYYEDLQCPGTQGTITTLNASLFYQTTGTAPNRIFTVEWKGMEPFANPGSDLSFQVKLFEGSNKIGLVYGNMISPLTPTYSCGINSVTLAGAPTTAMLLTQQTANTATFTNTPQNGLAILPATNSEIDFTYTGAAPSPLSGVFAIPGAYASIGAAINALNYNGTSGACTFNVAAGSVFIEDPAPLQTACGASAITFQCLAGIHPVIKPTLGGINTSGSGIRIMGGDNITFNGIDITINSGNGLNFGYLLSQNSNTNGAQNDIIQNSVVTLNKTNLNSIGFITSSVITPASVGTGANSNNIFRNVSVKNSFRGVLFNGGTTFNYGGMAAVNCPPDNGNQLTTTGCGTYNLIGDPTTPNDLGGTSSTTGFDPYGVGAFGQANLTVSYTKVQNLTLTGTIFSTGILISNTFMPAAVSAGTINVFNNQVNTLKTNSGGAADITGISLNSNDNAGSHIRVYNNFVADLTSGSTSAGAIGIVGIGIQDEGGTSPTATMELWHNSVSLSPAGIACSNTCLLTTQTTTGPVITVKNNIFANFTGAQGSAKHYSIISPSATAFGNTGSSSNYNDLFISNPGNGFVGLGAATTYATLANWSTGMGGAIDVPGQSLSIDPLFAGTFDLHIGAVGLNGSGFATVPAYIATDIDCQARPQPVATNFDMGADETQQCAVSVAGGVISPAAATACALQTYTMDAVGATTGIGITLQWEVSPTGGGVGFVDVSGGSAPNSTPYTTGSLVAGSYWYRLRVTCSSGPVTSYSNEFHLTVNPAPTVNVNPTTGTLCQPGASPITLTASGGSVSYAWSPATGLSAITGTSVSANPLITTTYTVTGTSAIGCTNTATAAISVGPSFAMIMSATPPAVCSGGNSQLNALVNSNANEILITEVTLFKAGTGATPTYPAYIGAADADFVELSNITSQPVDISGWTIADYGNNLSTATHSLIFPAGSIIPSNGVAVVHLGSGTTSIANRYFNTGGTTDFWGSGSLVGIVLKNGSVVIDAVGLNTGYTFNAATGVTGTDWSGFAPAPGTFAGTIRVGGTDTNAGSDWAQANTPTPLQSIGTYNGGYSTSLSIATYAWSPVTFLSSTTIANPIATAVTTTTTYTVLATSNAGCSASGNITVTIAPLACTSITSSGPRCAGSPTSVTVNTTGGCAPYNYAWTIDGTPFVGNTPTITPSLAGGSHLFAVSITSANGNCNTNQSIVINNLPAIAVNPPTSSICNPGGSAISLTASAGVTYSWNPSTGLSAITGATVTANPTSTTSYVVTGTDANSCVNTATAIVSVGPAITATATSSAPGTICPGTNSTTLTANITFPSLIYCNSRHDDGCNFLGFHDEITKVTLPTTTLDNSSGCASGAYTYYTGSANLTATISPGPSYSLTLTFGSDASQYAGAWIDYNKDGVLSASEFLGATGNAGASGTVSITFTVPATALNGLTRLRIVGGNDNPVTADQACDASSSTFGETEDYDVTITGGLDPISNYAWTPVTFLSSTSTNPTTAVNMTSTQTYTVTATTPSGCAATANVAVNVHPPVTATISGTNTICVGGSTIISIALTGTGPWTFTYTDGVTPVTVTNTSTNPYTFSVSPGSLTTYTLTAVSNAVCPGTFSGSAVITVNPVPVIAVNPPAPSYCPGGSVVLTASGATSYTWSPAGGLSATTGATVTANPAGTTTYTVTGTDPFPGCSATGNVTVTVNPSLPVSVTISSSSGTDICSGESVTFTAVPVNPGATPIYQWQVDGINVGTNSTTYVTTTLTNGQVVKCILTSNALCATGSPATSNTITMNVVSGGVASVAINPSATLCASSPITFTATPTNGGGTPTYEFFLNGGSVQNSASNTYILNSPVNGNTVSVTMTSSLSCATGSPASSPVYTVALNASPGLTPPTATCTSIFAGNSTTLTNAAAAGGAATITTYQWLLNGNPVGPNSSTYTTNVTGDYSVTITNSNGCVSTTAALTISPNNAALNAGTYNIPGSGACTDFQTIAAAVNHISAHGIANNGPVIFNIAGGYTETAPVGGYALTGLATGIAGSTITFKKAGGANPVITAAQQVASSNSDAIFKLIGADYITINDLTLQENVLNTNKSAGAGNTMTEWGIALLHPNLTPSNGAQHNIIQNNIIALDKTYRNSVGIYSNATHSETAPQTAQNGTGAGGQNSFNTVYSNAISNVNIPIIFVGAPANMDVTNDIGGASSATANTITNWGSNSTINSSTAVFNAVPVLMYGVYAANQTSLNISWNSLTSAAGIDVGATIFRGIYTDFTGAPSGTFTNAITNNTVTLSSATTAAGTLEGIGQLNAAGSGAVPGITLNINNNNIISGAITGASSASSMSGISNAFPSGVLSISANIIRSNTSSAISGTVTGISNSGAVPTSITMNNNQLGNASGDFINFSANTSSTIFGISNTGGANTAALSIQTNDIRRIVNAGTASGAQTYFNNTAATLSQNISSNSFTNLSVNTTGSITFISNSVILPANGTQTINSNVVVTNFAKTGTGGTILFYNSSATSNSTGTTITQNSNNFSSMSFVNATISGWSSQDAGANTKNVTTNTFNGITNTGAAAITVMNISGTTSATGGTISGNTIGTISGGGSITAINIPSVASTKATVSTNGITGITSTGGTITAINALSPTLTIGTNTISSCNGAGTVIGISASSITPLTTNASITSNPISLLSTTVGNVVGIQVSNGTGTINANVITNTISGLSSTSSSASPAIYGVQISSGALTNVTGNTISGLSGSGGTATPVSTGIIVQGGTTVTVTKNQVFDIAQTGTPAPTGPVVAGITCTSGPTSFTASNNFISDLKAPATSFTDAIRGINITSGTASSNINIWYNTVFLNASSSGAVFGTSGIFHTSSATATTAQLTLRNNIIDNESTPNGAGGTTTAFRRGNGTAPALANYNTASNRNLFYAGVPSATTVVYSDLSNTYINLSNMQAWVGPTRESLSIGIKANFQNSTTAPYDLRLKTDLNCSLEQLGDNNGILLADDIFATNVRSIVPTYITSIGADEFISTGTGPGFWRGVNSNWMDPINWCGDVPNVTTDVTIPVVVSPFVYPDITSTLPVARNITVNNNAFLTISPGGTLSTKGSWTINGTLTNNGTIVLNGTTNQDFPGGGGGTVAAMTNLTVNNTVGAKINQPLTITGTLKPKLGNIVIDKLLTLHSDASGTARVDTVQGTISYTAVTGKISVERYISSLTRTAWRFLSAPITGVQTINQAWQEGQGAGSYTGTGYGMQIVGPTAAGPGFDMNTATPSLKTYDGPTNTWVSVPGTAGPISRPDGYMAFIRGDRNANTFGAMNATTLRTTDTIKTGNIVVSVPNGTINQYISVGNPYPSAINFNTIATVKVGLLDVYYLWDPKIGTYGAYQTFAGPSYTASAGGPGSSYNGNNAIESGQAFFVISNGSVTPHSITIKENSKIGSNVQVARASGLEKQLSTRLYLVSDSSLLLYDGNRIDFDAAYSNRVDEMDAPKLTNFGESLGIQRDGKTISVERHADIVTTDTIFYQLSQFRQKEYQLEFTPQNLAVPGLNAWLEDNYLHTSKPIDLAAVTTANFTVTADADSKAPDRFRVVFRQLGPVPVSFTSIRAYRQDKDIMVNWNVENELSIARYDVERSADGINFSKLGTQTARGNGSGITLEYNLLDVEPLTGDNFYRIKSVDNGGYAKYSEVVKVNIAGDPSKITVYPNPLKEDGILKISMTNEPKGAYRVRLINGAGQTILSRIINHEGGNSVYEIAFNQLSISHGNYLIQISEGNKVKTTFKIVY